MGKTALVEGLALRIAEGNVPDAMKPVSVRTLDLGLLQAGAGVKGEFEQRLKNIIEAVQQSPSPVLLFIDEAHTIIGAGNQAVIPLRDCAAFAGGQAQVIFAAGLRSLRRRVNPGIGWLNRAAQRVAHAF